MITKIFGGLCPCTPIATPGPIVRRFLTNKLSTIGVLAGVLSISFSSLNAQSVTVVGEGEPTPRQWHRTTLELTGPNTSETANPNPFTNYRFDVEFRHPATGTTYRVPGYFAADGNAGETSASSGNKWHAHLSADHTGTWEYTIFFTQGANVAANGGGTPVAPYNGITNTFNVAANNKSAPDLRAKGRLEYVGERYYKFKGSGEYFIKQGTDSPEALFAYQDFDGPFKNDGVGVDSYIRTYPNHVSDWTSGDPTWASGTKGKGLIGLINYLSGKGLNGISFLTHNIPNGDDGNVFPWLTATNNENGKVRYDVSRLAQWEIVLAHAKSKGMYMDVKLQETEVEAWLDNRAVGVQRKTYFRELIARFGHHLALNWNLGEENGPHGAFLTFSNTQNIAQRRAMAQWLRDNDPYNHPRSIHNGLTPWDLVGNQSELTGYAFQGGGGSHNDVHKGVLQWVVGTTNTGKPWAVAADETGGAARGLRFDNHPEGALTQTNARRRALWGALMAGCYGNQWYFGFPGPASNPNPQNDLDVENLKQWDTFWDYCRHARTFFEDHVPFWTMDNRNDLIGNSNNNDGAGYCFANPGKTYVIFLPTGGTKNLNLNNITGAFTVKWYNPRTGGALINGSSITGGASRTIGPPPSQSSQDWVVLIEGNGTDNNPVDNSIDSLGPLRDAYLVNGTTLGTSNNLQVSSNQTSYIKFNTGGKAYPKTPTKLELTPTANGNVGLEVYIALNRNSSWKDSPSSSGTALLGAFVNNPTRRLIPDEGMVIGTYNGALQSGTPIQIDLGTFFPPGQWFDIIVKATSGSGSFFSDGTANQPELLFGGGGSSGGGNDTLVCGSLPASVEQSATATISIDYEADGPRDIVLVVKRPGGSNVVRPRLTVTQGSGTATFTVDLSGETVGTDYSFRSFMYNVGGDWDIAGSTEYANCSTPIPFSLTAPGSGGGSTIDTLDCSSLPASVQQSATATISIDYEATGPRDIVLVVKRPGGSNAVRPRQTVSATSGSTTATFTVDLSGEPAGTGYTFRAFMYNVGGDWNITGSIEYANCSTPIPFTLTADGGGGGPGSTTDTLVCSSLPSSVEQSATASVSIDYEATGSRDIVLVLRSATTWLANSRQTVSATTGPTPATFNLDLSGLQPGTYFLRAFMYNVGGDWNIAGSTTYAQCNGNDYPFTLTTGGGGGGGGGTVTETPTQDAYIQGTTQFNDSNLKVEPNFRTSYLKFDINGINGAVTGAKLILQPTEAGSGTVRVYQGNSNPAWTEATLTASNAPGQGAQLGLSAGSYVLGNTLEIDLGTSIGNGEITFVITMDGGGNDVWFSSSEGATSPRLEVTYQ
ncbi:MAG: DUF5060 domain-containing protein [Verrucomicrobiota bacterium]